MVLLYSNSTRSSSYEKLKLNFMAKPEFDGHSQAGLAIIEEHILTITTKFISMLVLLYLGKVCTILGV